MVLLAMLLAASQVQPEPRWETGEQKPPAMRGRFVPARDEFGLAVTGRTIQSIMWRLRDDAPLLAETFAVIHGPGLGNRRDRVVQAGKGRGSAGRLWKPVR